MDHNNRRLGFLRLADHDHRNDIVMNVELCFEDIYDSIDGLRDNLNEFEEVINRILYGENHGSTDEGKSLREKLTL